MKRDKGRNCVACKRESSRQWRANNPEKSREKARQWRANNPEKHRENCRNWAANNREKSRENSRNWYASNSEKSRENFRKRYASNSEKFRERACQWAANNPEKVRAISHTRRARKAGNGGSFTAQEWKDLCAQYDNHCIYPGCERTDLHADHVIPVSKGGSSDISNIQPLCAHHNISKGTGTNDYRYKPGLKRWKQSKLLDF